MAADPPVEVKVKKLSISPKFNKKFISAEIKLRDLCSQLTLQLYGKTLTTGPTGCLGQAQNVLVRKNKDLKLLVCIPSAVWANANEVVGRKGANPWSGMGGKPVTLKNYMNNVIAHGRSKGLKIDVIYT